MALEKEGLGVMKVV